jgi:hypothetical protein
MARRKSLPETVTGGYTAVPWAVLDSLAFIGATDNAKSILFALMRQHNGLNNGRLQLVDGWLAKHGWSSSGMNRKSRDELIERSLIIQTRKGGLNCGCNWFALTWLPISNFVGLEVSAQTFHRGAWAGCSLPPTARRKPPQKREKSADSQRSAAPVIGVVKLSATPVVGVKTELFHPLATPVVGNNVSVPIPPIKSTRAKKRIVGKVGRSGIKKELHKPQSATGAL